MSSSDSVFNYKITAKYLESMEGKNLQMSILQLWKEPFHKGLKYKSLKTNAHYIKDYE